jgi:hypothetical protein
MAATGSDWVVWFDAASLAVAIVAGVGNAIRRRVHGSKIDQATILRDVLSGAALVPFLAMTASAFWPEVFYIFSQSNHVVVSLAGFLGCMFVVNEILRN